MNHKPFLHIFTLQALRKLNCSGQLNYSGQTHSLIQRIFMEARGRPPSPQLVDREKDAFMLQLHPPFNPAVDLGVGLERINELEMHADHGESFSRGSDALDPPEPEIEVEMCSVCQEGAFA